MMQLMHLHHENDSFVPFARPVPYIRLFPYQEWLRVQSLDRVKQVKTEFLTRSQVAALFGVSPHTVTRWAREGRLPSHLTPGGQRRYPRVELEDLHRILSQEEAPRRNR